jgi:hypothetical protein
MDVKAAGTLGGCIVAAALIFTSVPRSPTVSGPTRGDVLARIQSAEAKIKVHYMVQVSPTSAEGGDVGNVSDIEFYPHYVTLKTKDGDGTVLFNERTRALTWSRQ